MAVHHLLAKSPLPPLAEIEDFAFAKLARQTIRTEVDDVELQRVVDELQDMQSRGRLVLLVLSDRNVGMESVEQQVSRRAVGRVLGKFGLIFLKMDQLAVLSRSLDIDPPRLNGGAWSSVQFVVLDARGVQVAATTAAAGRRKLIATLQVAVQNITWMRHRFV